MLLVIFSASMASLAARFYFRQAGDLTKGDFFTILGFCLLALSLFFRQPRQEKR